MTLTIAYPTTMPSVTKRLVTNISAVPPVYKNTNHALAILNTVAYSEAGFIPLDS